MKKFVCLFILICMLSICLVSCNSIRYNEALDLIAEGNYEAAHKMFEKLDSYKDAKKQLKYFHYVPVKVEYHDNSFCDFFYNENNLPKQTIDTNSDGGKSIRDYTYDANGNIIKEVCTDPDGDIEFVDITYKFVYIPYELSEQVEEILGDDIWR